MLIKKPLYPRQIRAVRRTELVRGIELTIVLIDCFPLYVCVLALPLNGWGLESGRRNPISTECPAASE
jgi:hypothetical protein